MRILKLGLVCVFLAGCGGPESSAEEALRAWIAAAEAAAEEKDRRRLLAMISNGYVDSRGNRYEDVDSLLRLYFLRQDTVAIVTNIDEIVVTADTAAKITLTVGMAGRNNMSSFGIDADAYNFELELENTEDEWILIGSRWGQVGKELH